METLTETDYSKYFHAYSEFENKFSNIDTVWRSILPPLPFKKKTFNFAPPH